MKVAKDLVVSLAYQVRTEDGVLVDESPVSAPLDYLHGHGSLISGLENALDGHEVGDKFDVAVGANDAYGQYDENLVQRVPKDVFMGVDELQVGMRFLAETDQGPVPVEITEVEDDHVVVDGNHMLAGQNLKFNVEVVASAKRLRKSWSTVTCTARMATITIMTMVMTVAAAATATIMVTTMVKAAAAATVAAAATNLCASARRRQKSGETRFFYASIVRRWRLFRLGGDMGGLGRLQLLDHQTHMLPHLRHLDLVGGHGFVEVFDGDFLKRQPAFQLRKARF